jgi:hypothetical protein
MNDNEIPEGYLPDAFRKKPSPNPFVQQPPTARLSEEKLIRIDTPGALNYVEHEDLGLLGGIFACLFLVAVAFFAANCFAFVGGLGDGCAYHRYEGTSCAPRAKWRYVFPGWTAGAMLRTWLDAPEGQPAFPIAEKLPPAPYSYTVSMGAGGAGSVAVNFYATEGEKNGLWQQKRENTRGAPRYNPITGTIEFIPDSR